MHLGCITIPAWNTWSCRSGLVLWGDTGQAGLLGLGYLRHGHSGPLARPGPGDSSLPQQSVLCPLKLSQVLVFVVFLLYGPCLFLPITVISLQLCSSLGLFSPRKDFGGTVPVCSCFGPSLLAQPWALSLSLAQQHCQDEPWSFILCMRSTWGHHVPERSFEKPPK